MKYYAAFSILFFAVIAGQSQNYLTDLVQGPYEKLFRADHHLLYSLLNKKNSIFYDNRAVDSTHAYLESAALNNGKWVCSKKKNNKYFIMIISLEGKTSVISDPNSASIDCTTDTYTNRYATGKIAEDSLEELITQKIISENHYKSKKQNPYDKKLYSLSPFTGLKNKMLFDLDKLFKDSINHTFDLDQIGYLYEIDDSNLLVRTCYDQNGGLENLNYFVYNSKTNTVKRLKHIYKREYDKETNTLWLYFSDVTQKYHVGEYNDYGVRNDDHKGYFIFDTNIQVISRALPRYSENIGFNYVNGRIDSYNIRSRLDDDKSVIVPFKLELALERSMTRIYNNQEILPEDIKSLNTYSANILKNFIYAKHNFKFTEIFYEAYFNLFEFYNGASKKTSRLTKVDNLFTLTDKKSLAVINAILSKSR